MSGVVVVREARPDELGEAGEIVGRAYLGLGIPPDEPYLAQVRDAVGRARHCPVLVATDAAGTLLGSVTYVPGPDNPYAEVAREGEAGFRMLGVAPGAQERGVGEALVRACVDRARAAGRTGVAISTSPTMTAAHRLYERLGFRRVPDRDHVPVPGVELWAYLLVL